jgi:4-amino-4-deoxy-L-arabinose transferase-like glycosyltransferase
VTAAVRARLAGAGGLVGLAGPVALAAVLRLMDLATRSTWDGDQGHDMLVLRALVRDGVVPLLGPPTSLGDFHHGALYYYLLAPAAALTGGDSPVAVVLLIALIGIAAVAVTWWLARSIGGPVAGFVAGLAMAVSPAAIDESTFIWNPNLIGLASALALAGAWSAWSTRRPVWWLLAAAGTAVTMQSHVLGATILPMVAALWVADARRRPSRAERSAVIRSGLVGLGLVAASFLPLVANELTTDFSEIGAALAYLGSGGQPSALGLLERFVVIAIRVVSWPIVGLLTDGLAAAVLAVVAVVAVVVWRSTAGGADERTATRWLGLGLAWSAFVLTFAAPSLSVVVAGLPNDHYHAFADPMVFVLVGLGAAALWRAGPGLQHFDRIIRPGRVVAFVAVLAIVAWGGAHLRPAVHPDGGFPAAERAVTRIETAAGPGPIWLRSLPAFKSVEAYAYPLVRGGRSLLPGATVGEATLDRPGAPTGAPASLVVICDVLFESAIGAACGGPAESALEPDPGALVDRFEAAPGRVISIYRAATR